MLPYHKIFTQASTVTINKYSAYLDRYMAEFQINTPLRQAHFLSQLAVESGELRYTEENLKYSATRLLQVFPKYFRTIAEARAVAYDPVRIANIVYANRIGNGNTASGDGYTFRGRGLIQLTGRANYAKFAQYLHDHPATTAEPVPDGSPEAIAPLVSQPQYAVLAACWFWKANGLNEIADRGATDQVIELVTRRVNGGKNGLSQRTVYFYRAIVALKNT